MENKELMETNEMNVDDVTSDYGEFKKDFNKSFKQNIYFFIMSIAAVGVISLAPFLGSTQDIVSKFPNTPAGWIVWVTIRFIMACLNFTLFYCFTEQGKLNIRDDPKYLKAKELLISKTKSMKPPMNPKTWEKRQYTIKGAIVAVITVAAGFGISQAVIAYDYVALISYILTCVFGVVVGLIQMKQAEYYWTDEFYAYAIYKSSKIEAEELKKQEEIKENKNLDIAEELTNDSNR